MSDAARPPAGDEPPELSLVGEVLAFLRENRKWWLMPMLFAVLVLGALVVLTASPLSPFIYSLF